MAAEFDEAELTGLSPWGLRLPADTRVDDHPAFAQGLVEVQDEGSQLIALACQPESDTRIVDLCAGAGGKALALAAAAPTAAIIASDTNRARLAQLGPRAERAGAKIESRLLDGGREIRAACRPGQVSATSSWSTLLAAGRAHGAAIPKDAGG